MASPSGQSSLPTSPQPNALESAPIPTHNPSALANSPSTSTSQGNSPTIISDDKGGNDDAGEDGGPGPNSNLTQPLMQQQPPGLAASPSSSVVLADTPVVTPHNGPPPLTRSREEDMTKILRDVFMFTHFRPNQREIIEAALEGKDLLILLPSGSGKGLCYQLPAVCTAGTTHGMTVVISHLSIKDQVDELKQKGVDAVSATSGDDLPSTLSRLRGSGRKPRLLYIPPERLRHSDMMTIITQLHQDGQLARFVIDEAQCISTWSRDFRVESRSLGQLRNNYPGVPITVLTAIADQPVRDDILGWLGIQNKVATVSESKLWSVLE